ncbi:MAG: cysteinyl-tRNA synthetase [Candidatus Berkelbacteria bacterium Gr01-1014_85]|uniref:Cysteine--tRNA ligase n=1 Tax=Candidatus Berkelbacteria bacterium Gr01-1014_85 TaxID=2017150 RepID=A0A554J8X6_9BACT|nr:MAG: cysteinyl-tRNA synthetase [Candidatus Berkelbacteria bacterium Gr01-1014_85]
MAEKYLGKTIDLHLGGVDLIFPHHENEIAQSEAANGQPFVRYFVHGEHMTLNGQRMGKSLGNAWTVDDLIEQGISPLAYRYLWLTTHYRSKLNLTLESLQAAQTTLKQLKRLSLEPESLSDAERGQLAIKILALIEDDLNFPAAVAELHAANSYLLWLLFEPILGLGLEPLPDEASYPDAIRQLINRRKTARAQKQFELSDQIRVELEESGYLVEDRVDHTVTVQADFLA